MSNARWLRPWPAGSPEASSSARSCSRLPRASASQTAAWKALATPYGLVFHIAARGVPIRRKSCARHSACVRVRVRVRVSQALRLWCHGTYSVRVSQALRLWCHGTYSVRVRVRVRVRVWVRVRVRVRVRARVRARALRLRLAHAEVEPIERATVLE
eukprot:scaffold36251_cov42-Phaeocystis_antarctica.AAC.2